MGTSRTVIQSLQSLMEEQERTPAWVARRTGLPYKRVLSEVKHGKNLKLDTAIAVADALGASLPDLIDRAQKAAA